MAKSSSQAKYILYARKSTESEDRQVLSIDSQISELKALAEREGLTIVCVMQESRSAKQLGRPVFADMMARIARGEASGILCWKLDRLARNFIDGGQVIEMIQRGVVQHIRSFERSYYPEDNVLLMAVELGMANQFSRDLAVNEPASFEHRHVGFRERSGQLVRRAVPLRANQSGTADKAQHGSRRWQRKNSDLGDGLSA